MMGPASLSRARGGRLRPTATPRQYSRTDAASLMPLPCRRIQSLAIAALFGVAMSGCARARATVLPTPAPPAAIPVAVGGSSDGCAGCGEAIEDAEVMRAVATRIAALKARGGVCLRHAEVLEGSLAANRIVVRPFMWRVGPFLASAQAKSTGEIDVAREIDILNVGRRSLDEVVHSIEHEAAHIAFAIPSGSTLNEARVDEWIGRCRGKRAG